MPLLTITKTYIGGATLYRTDLDNALDSISTFLNTTKIDSLNVQTGGLIGTNLAAATIGNAQLGAACVGASNIASSAVTTAAIGPQAVTSDQILAGTLNTLNIASSAITSAKLAVNLSLPGKAVQESGSNLVVSTSNATNSLAIVRGGFHWNGIVIVYDLGEGFTVSRSGTGIYDVTVTGTFSDSFAATSNVNGNSAGSEIHSTSNTGFQIRTYGNSFSSTPTDQTVSFIASAQRS